MVKPSSLKLKKSKTPKSTLKPFDEIYNDYLKSGKTDNDKLQRNKDIKELYEKYDIDNPDPIFDSADTLLDIVINEKDWEFLYYLIDIELEIALELFFPTAIQGKIENASLEQEWYNFLKDYYHKNINDDNVYVIIYINFTQNLDLFKMLFTESDFENMVKNNTKEYQSILRHLKNKPSFIGLLRKYMDYDSKELDLICKSDENQYLPFENISYNIIIPITYYINAEEPTHVIRTSSLINLESIMNYTFEKADYNIGLMKYLDVDGPTIDKNFFKKNQTFLKETLSTKEIFMLSGYTFNGDVLANLFLKLKANVSPDAEDEFSEYVLNWRSEKKKNKRRQIRLNSLFYQLAKRLNNYDYDFVDSYLEKVKRDDAFIQLIKECVEEYVDDLKKIFDKAPSLDEDMVVFRGVSTMYYKKDNSDRFYNNTFMSTSLNPNTALDFSAKECCLKKITLKRGFNKIIFIEPITQVRGEYELLIPPDTEFKILKHEELKKETTFDYDHIKDKDDDKRYSYYLYELCRHPVSFKTFTTMESV
jgi:hypothetical protein